MEFLLLLPWLNFSLLIVSLILFAGFYIPSLMPAKLAEIRGETAWKLCERLRIIGTIFMVVALIAILLWLWFPFPHLAGLIHPNPWVGIILGLLVFLISLPIWIKGIKDAGAECKTPSKKSKMFGGIYNYIRHPQTLGEISWFIAGTLFVNSFFLLILILLFLLIYLPIMLHVEEQDLIKRFGQEYINYREKTGALIPKFWRKTQE